MSERHEVTDRERGAAVERLGLLDTGAEERFDRITRLARQEFGVALALVNLVGEDTIFTKSQPAGMTTTHSPFGVAFCEHTVRQDGLLEIDDAAADPRYSGLAAVTDYGMRFYAGVPLTVASGEAVATLCLYDSKPRHLDGDERDLLERLGRWAQAELRTDDPLAPVLDAQAVEHAIADGEQHPEAADGSPTREAVETGHVRLASLAIPFGTVSGDASAWAQSERRLVITLADVMGKGEAAGAIARAVIDGLHGDPSTPPSEAVRRLEELVGPRLREQDAFTTVFHAVLDTESGELDYVDAGHGLTLHLTADGASTRLHSRNLPLGLLLDGGEWESGRIIVQRGDLIVTVSDGALDAYDSTLESLIQLEAELRAALDTGSFFDALTVRVSEHLVDDDVTALVLAVR